MKLVRVSAYLTEAQLEWLRRNYALERVKMSDAIRDAVQDYVEKHPLPEVEPEEEPS